MLENEIINLTAAIEKLCTIMETKEVEPVTVEPVTVEPVIVEPVIVEPVTVEPVIVEPVTVEPVIVKPVTHTEDSLKELCLTSSKTIEDGRTKVRAILAEYNAKKVAEIPTHLYSEVVKKLEELV